MIARFRIVGVEPGKLDAHKGVVRDWAKLIRKYGGNVLGFYFDEERQEAIGIAEYESREHLAEIKKNYEDDPDCSAIMKRTEGLYTSFEEKIVDKLDIGE